MSRAPLPSDEELVTESRTLRQIDRLLRAVPGARSDDLPLGDLVGREADAVVAAHRAGRPETAYLVRGDKYRPGKSAATDAEVLATAITQQSARESMARWHWYSGWSDIAPRGHQIVDHLFESACDAIVDGDADALQTLITRKPTLVHSRSCAAHHQTLLQHVAANGIENSRQWQSPPNAVEIAEVLLAAGSDPDARCDSYGCDNTTMTLLVSSAHPARAGVQADLVEALCRGGAKPDGPDDDGMPLWSAISAWSPRAVDALVRCGARVDNLLYAAAAGLLPLVTSYFDGSGRLIRERACSWGRAR